MQVTHKQENGCGKNMPEMSPCHLIELCVLLMTASFIYCYPSVLVLGSSSPSLVNFLLLSLQVKISFVFFRRLTMIAVVINNILADYKSSWAPAVGSERGEQVLGSHCTHRIANRHAERLKALHEPAGYKHWRAVAAEELRCTETLERGDHFLPGELRLRLV